MQGGCLVFFIDIYIYCTYILWRWSLKFCKLHLCSTRGMHDRWGAGHEGCTTVEVQDMRNARQSRCSAGHEGCTTGEVQDIRNARQVGYRTWGFSERRLSGNESFMKRGMQDFYFGYLNRRTFMIYLQMSTFWTQKINNSFRLIFLNKKSLPSQMFLFFIR